MARVQMECPKCRVSGMVDKEKLERARMRFRCPKCGEVHQVEAVTASGGSSVFPLETSSSAPNAGSASERSDTFRLAPPPADKAEGAGLVPPPANEADGAGPSEPASPIWLRFHGSGGSLFGIMLKNLIFSIITLGFYRFWGKVKVRQYLYGQTEVSGDRLVHLGTGRELLIGWVKAVLIIAAGILLLKGLEFVHPGFIVLTNLGILAVIGFAKVGSLRYRLSRTSLRGIRFSFRGGYKQGILLFVGGTLLSIFTLGLYYPYFRTRMRGFWLNNCYFGNTGFSYTGKGRDLFWRYLLALPLTLLTLGVYLFWFIAEVDRYDWRQTSFPGVALESSVRGGALLRLQAGNLLLLVFTLGLAMPWIIIRSLAFRCRNISFAGQADFEGIRQDLQAAKATGEGVADYMDMDFGVLDFGIL